MRLAVCAITCAAAWAAVGGAARAGAFDKGPYLQNVSRSSVTVMWESSRERACAVEVVDAAGRVARAVAAEPEDLHEVVVDGLDAGTRYRYRVVCDDEQAEGEFATAPEPDAPFMFVAFGDSRSNARAHRAVVERIRREVPDFLLGTGDYVNEGSSLAEWQEFFDIERELLAENVLFPALGNHDRQGRGRTADNYRMYFAVPENAPNPERYYAFTYGNSRFLVLDSNAYSFALTDQTAWIEQQLQAAQLDRRIRHVFVVMHHPPFSVSIHGGHSQLRDAWTPLFERYGVDAVFSGHDHNYQRAERGGVRYFVTGGGGAPLYPRSRRAAAIDRDAVRYMERVNHYLRVHVIGDHVEVAAFRADGTLIETVSWGAMPERRDALLAFAAGAGRANGAEPAPRARPAAAVRRAAASGGERSFGWLGRIGALLALGAGAIVVRTVRS